MVGDDLFGQARSVCRRAFDAWSMASAASPHMSRQLGAQCRQLLVVCRYRIVPEKYPVDPPGVNRPS